VERNIYLRRHRSCNTCEDPLPVLTFMTKDGRHISPVTVTYTASSKGSLNTVRIMGIAEKQSVGKLQILPKGGAGGTYSYHCHSKC
jgi:hypothetical protein